MGVFLIQLVFVCFVCSGFSWFQLCNYSNLCTFSSAQHPHIRSCFYINSSVRKLQQTITQEILLCRVVLFAFIET